MKQTDMELQAIREKLQSLQAEPQAAETLSLPWASNDHGLTGQTSHRSGQEHHNPTHADNIDLEESHATQQSRQPHGSQNKSPQEIAIETLKQRSRGGESASARIDNLMAQELYRLEVQANLINEQSQKQAENILALKRSAQQASIGLRRQGIQNHSQLAIITEFLEHYPSVAVPHIDRDSQGTFTLSYITVDFQQAEQDAIDTAHALRNRQQQTTTNQTDNVSFNQEPPSTLFSQPLPPLRRAHKDSAIRNIYAEETSPTRSSINNPGEPISTTRPRKNRLQKSLGNTIDKVLYLLGSNQERKRQTVETNRVISNSVVSEGIDLFNNVSTHSTVEGFVDHEGRISHTDADFIFSGPSKHGNSHPFSWLDGTIWFSGAAIARIIIQTIALSYPIVQTLFVITLASAITFALYRVVIARSENYNLIYRLCIAMAGLLLASLFR
ncbi:MAG: hypothetical protein AB8B99_05600 [Phormidesmis sp.]